MGKPAPLYIVALLSLLASKVTDAQVPANFLPFGNGDTVNPVSDDGSSQAISLQQPFKYFGRTYNQIYVNNNGHVTFTQALSAYVPYRNTGIDIIAPLWTDLNNVNGGTISYREDTSSAVLAQVTQAVNQYYPSVPFTARSAFVATWNSVPYYSHEGVATFQIVLASNGDRSFILINYGQIAQTARLWLAGYDTLDSVNSFTIPAASAPELSSSSNINVNGRWSFRVDGSSDLLANFLPFGNGDTVNPVSDDGSSQAISLQQPFKYFGRTYNQIYVNNNGHVTFTRPLSAFVPYRNAGIDIIAPLWADLYNVNGGTISYREDTSSAVLAQVTRVVNQYYPNVRFTARSAFVATWDRVPYISGGGVVTFQLILVSNGARSFILINYGNIAQTGQVWLAGYDTVDSLNSFTIPAASAPELSSTSNVNVNGRWSFRVDHSNYNFLPFGNGDIVNPISDDGSSGAISLQQPFKYFGRRYNQIYVNNNGHVTFTQALSAFVPYRNAGIDIIAPLWTDLYNVNSGTISYREDTSSAVLAQVTQAVNQYYPNVRFTATSAFVATWDSVPYITGGGEVTFQLVLVSNNDHSFILINYGDIAQTGRIWLAGYDTVDSLNSFTIPAASPPELSSTSNVNLNGRWSFRVDRSPNLPANFLPYGNEDIVNPISDDGSSQAIVLQQPFKYFGRTYNQIYVNNNGHVTFTRPLSAFVPYLHAGIDIIAPLWTDLYNVNGGTISYREDTSSAVLAQVTQAVNQYYRHVRFTARSAFVATWDSVPYISGGGVVTFQLVLVSNGERSFILIHYGNIAQTGQVWLAGYDTVDSVSSFTIPAASPPELSSSSNINVNGRWSFHVDGSPDFPANFLPFGNGDVVNPISDDGSSGAILLQQPFNYFGRTYNHIYVNNNGHLTFTRPLSAYIPYLNAGIDIIAPLWTDLYNVNGGTISYREDTSSAVLAQVTQAVNQYFPHVSFTATSAFVATWDSVPYITGGGVVTFQIVLVSNAARSFILINYGDIAETSQSWLAGYDTVDSVNSLRFSVASAGELSSSSNINVIGRWSFHVDLPVNFLPFGDGDIVNPISDDGSSEAIVLQQPFKYFGRRYNHIYVNNNGHLTFTRPLSAYVPYLNAGIDIVAAFWTDLNNGNGGTISYREDTSRAILAYVSQVVNQYFPHVPFTARSAFVATWDSVPYYSGGGVATFQVILVSSGDNSYVLINYGNIAQTGQIWLAGYDTLDAISSFTIPGSSARELSFTTNINVNGRWSFRIDGSANYCDTCTENESCQERSGIYGCVCSAGQRTYPGVFDAVESCVSSTGTMSLSRCQLFESGFSPESLHLNDPNCRGTLEDGRVRFYFNNEDHICGTTLTNNRTHFIYQNAIQSNLRSSAHNIISRARWMNITFSCAYPLIQTLSMPLGIQAQGGVISQDIPGQGTYQMRMIPYHDAQFTSPYEGEVEIQVNQQMYVAVEVEGVDMNQIATVLDNCWATPVNDINSDIRWSLIIRECPNPEDGTVEVLQNGNGITSHFSFRMFTFSGNSDRIFLHCQVHLCLVNSGRCAQSCDVGNRRRRRRSLDFQHSAAITMGL